MENDKVIEIHKISIDDIPGRTHCWAPIVNGKALEYKGEPPFCIKAAKKATAVCLGIPVEEIEFKINR